MTSLIRVLAFGLVASQTLALPTESTTEKKRGFSVSGVHHHHPKPTHIGKRTEQGAVEAIYDGGGWLLPVLIGGQQLILNIDTGSSDIWTASQLLSAQERSYVKTYGGNFLYNSTQSKTYKRVQGETYSLAYGDGSASSGIVGSDIVNVGGASVRMPFGVCNNLKLGQGQTSRNSDGPLGLGWGSVNSERPKRGPTFMEAVENMLPEPIFATYLRNDTSGQVDFGYMNTNLYQGQLTTIPIHNTTDPEFGQWGAFDVTFGIPGTKFTTPGTAMDFDLGTASLNIPTSAAKQYFSHVKGAKFTNGIWNYPCSSTLPNFIFYFNQAKSGPKAVTVPANAMYETSDGQGTCYTWIRVISSGGGNVGMPLYLSKYLVFHQKVPSITMANQKPQ